VEGTVQASTQCFILAVGFAAPSINNFLFGGEMKYHRILILAIAATALLLQACAPGSNESAIQTGIAQTLQIAQLQTAAAGGGQPQQPAATTGPADTQAPTETPSITLTNTPSIPFVSVSQNTNCRTGPSQFYGYVTTANAGQQFEVLATYNGANYVVIRNPNGSGDCWLWLQYANVTNFASFNLPVATQPPTPFPTATATNTTAPYDWNGNWNIKAVNGGSTYTGSMSCTITANGQDVNCSGTLNPGALPYTFGGDLSDNHQTVSGSFGGTGSGAFAAQIKSGNLNQFIGNLESGVWEFCGWRNGSSAPSPCEWP
jgi:hypothetical protein